MTLAWVATCVFFLGVAPAGGARTKKSNDATALHNFEAQAEKVERLRASLAAGLKAEVGHLFGYTPKKRPADDLDAVLMDTDGSDVAKKWAAILKKTFPASQTSVAQARQTSVAKAKVDEPVRAAKKAESKPMLKPVMKPVISLQEITERVKTLTNETIKSAKTPLVPFEDERPSLRRNPITAEVRALGLINVLPSDGPKSLVDTIAPLSKNRRTGASGMQILDRWTEKFKKDFPKSTPRGKTIFDGLIQELEKLNKDAPKRLSTPTTPVAFNEEKGKRTKLRVADIDKKIAKEQESLSKLVAAAKLAEERHLTRNDLEGEGVDKVSKTSNVRVPNSDKKRRNLPLISLAHFIRRHVWSSILILWALATVGGFYSVWRLSLTCQREEADVKVQALYRGSKFRRNIFGEQNPLDYRLSTVNAGQ